MTDNNGRLTEWEKWVSNGSADSLFAAYSSDEELSDKMNKLLPGEGTIPPEQVRRDRERFHQLPRRGETRDEKQASPTKHVILNKSRQLNVEEALAEIVDNIVDNYERNPSPPTKLEVEITVYPPTEASPGELVVKENSGGIPGDRIVSLIQLGASDRGSSGIGAWGEGFKMAVFALGQEIEVFSTAPRENPIGILFPRGWLNPQHRLWTQWKVDVFAVSKNAPPEGTTIVRASHLHRKVSEYFGLDSVHTLDKVEAVTSALATFFGEVYAEKYQKFRSNGQDVTINLRIGSVTESVTFIEPVETRLRNNLSFLPWLRPIIWRKRFDINFTDEDRTAVLDVEIYAGLAATNNYSPIRSEQVGHPGAEMWGNGRLFSLKGPISDETVGWGYTFGGSGGRNPLANASSRRLTIVALFSASDSRDIPWAAPVKNDYNRRSDFYAEIRETFARVIRLFKDSVSILEFVLLMFSKEWTTYSNDQKLRIIFRDVNPSPEFLESFSNSRFGRKILKHEPTLNFKEVAEDMPSVPQLYGLEASNIRSIAVAAAETKQFAEQRVEFLRAIFPALLNQAQIEEQMGLAENEEFNP